MNDNDNMPTEEEARVAALTPAPQDDEPTQAELPSDGDNDLDPDEQGKAVHA